jgi:hypothetical protein
VYEVTAGALLLNATVSNGDTMGLRLNINSGTSFKDIALIRHQGAFTSNYLLNGTVKVSLSEGDELIVEAFQNSDPSLTVNASDTQSYVSITKEEATLGAFDAGNVKTRAIDGASVESCIINNNGSVASFDSTTPCSSWLSNPTRVGTGDIDFTFSPPFKTGTTPVCHLTPVTGTTDICGLIQSSTSNTSGSIRTSVCSSGAASDVGFSLTCVGVR